MKRKGFTLIELIVVMVILAILILLGVPKYKEYVKDAYFTRIMTNTKALETASSTYYMKHNDWPRLTDTPYTSEELESYAQEIYDKTGKEVKLDEDGNYYDISYVKIKNYIKKPQGSERYILQNPVGVVYYLDKMTEVGYQWEETKKIEEDLEGGKETEEVNQPANVVFKGLPDAAFDNDVTTTTGGGTVTWEGDLSNRVICINIVGNGSNGGSFGFKDAAGNNIEFLDSVGNTHMSIKSFYTGTIHYVVVPEGAVSLSLYGITTVRDIHLMEDTILPKTLKNIKTEPFKTSVKLTWDLPTDEDYKTVYIFRDGVKIGESIPNEFMDLTGLYVNTEYTYSLVAVDTTGNISRKVSVTTKTLDSDIYWYGLGPQAFDNNINTSTSGNGTVTWEGDLSNKVICVNIVGNGSNGGSFSFKDAAGNNIEFLDSVGNTYTSIKSFYKGTIHYVVVPEDAVSLALSGITTVKDIHLMNDSTPPEVIKNIKAEPYKTSVKLTWDLPEEEDFKSVYIFRDGVKIGVSTTNEFTDLTGAYANTEYTYSLASVDTTGNMSRKSSITTKTLEREVYWSGLGAQAFDGISTTSIGAGTLKVKWEGDLAGKTVYLHLMGNGSNGGSFNIKDANGVNMVFMDTAGKSYTSIRSYFKGTTHNIIIPEGAVAIQLNGIDKVVDIYELSLKE